MYVIDSKKKINNSKTIFYFSHLKNKYLQFRELKLLKQQIDTYEYRPLKWSVT